MLNQVTACIPTFMRDKYLRNCVTTLKHTYPDIRVIVGDQDPTLTKAAWLSGQGVNHYLPLPRDCGISFARNRMLERVTTPYVLIVEDDFAFSPMAHVPELLGLLGEFQIAGGGIVQNGTVRHYEANFREVPDNGAAKWEAITHLYRDYNGIRYQSAECIFNYFVGLTDAVRAIGWDEQFKIGYEHSDFFIRAKQQGVSVGYCPDAVVTHRDNRVQVDPPEYTASRLRTESTALFFKKWGYTYLEDIQGGRLYAEGSTKVLPGRPAPPIYQAANFTNPFKRAAAKRGISLAADALADMRITHWLSNGTLLGAVRDGNFIQHDTDIDLGVWDEGANTNLRIHSALMSRGFEFVREFGVRGNGYEQAYYVPGPHKVKLDIFFYRREADYCWMGLHTRDGMKRMRFPSMTGISHFNLLGRWYPVPGNAHSWLDANYGKDWGTPDTNWKWDTSPRNLEG